MKTHKFAPLAAGSLLALGLALGGCAAPQQAPQASSEDPAPVSSAEAATSSAKAGTVSSGSNTTSSSSSSSSSSSAVPSPSSASDQEIIDNVLDNFTKLAAIPHQSGREQAISDFLRSWAEEHGYQVTQDAANNIIFDVPATQGLDKLPMVGLQAHMDMVCVAGPDVTFNPATDAIGLIRDDAAGTLRADRTSLGAEGGIGMAMIMDIVEGNMAHGPLRVILTTDEEGEMTGIETIDEQTIDELGYLVNIESENSSHIVVSSAGGASISTTGSLEVVAPTGNSAATITLDGLLGGHSGLQIGEGHCNAIRSMAALLKWLSDSGVQYELVSIQGGTAENTIPASATATIVYASQSDGQVRDLVSQYANTLANDFAGIETKLSLRIDAANMPELVLTGESRDNALGYVLDAFDGVYTISSVFDDFVESSSNLGVLSINTRDGFSALSYVRSSEIGRFDEIRSQQLGCATKYGFDTLTGVLANPWPYDPDSKLADLCLSVFEKNNDRYAEQEIVHAVLEAGVMKALNPDLDLVSVGPDVRSANSPDETLVTSSIPITWRLVEGVLAGIE